jgi:hypothetical protein
LISGYIWKEKNMLITTFVIAVYVIGCFLIGRPMAKKSLDIWEQGGKIKNWDGDLWGFLLFPMHFYNENVGEIDPEDLYSISGIYKSENFVDMDKDDYVYIQTRIWPFRIVWNIISMFVICVLCTFCTRRTTC